MPGFFEDVLFGRKVSSGENDPASTGRREPSVIQESERKAFLAISEAMDGPNWRENLCWDGVTVDSEGRVLELRLNGKGLKGELPEALRNLRHLKVLHLHDNELEGAIPEWLGKLVGLEDLRLFNNSFRGEIPEALRNLRHLKILMLDSNKLHGAIPDWLRELVDLKQLGLSGNSFRGEVPDALTNLRHVKVLHLDNNNLEGAIPEWLGELGGLEYLGLTSNSFRGEIPEALRNLRFLKILRLGSNKLEGTIPAWLGELAGLEDLHLSNNSFRGEVPEALRNLRHLKVLGLQSNKLEGEVPEALRNLRHLKVLGLHSNKLEGAIPEWLGELAGLEELDLSKNSLRGEFPEALRNLRHLNILHLHDNELEGAIPEWLGELAGLEQLGLSNNSFRGEVPEALRNLRHLKVLGLQSNKLEGAIPEWLGELGGLVQLGLSNNSFRGEVPEALRNVRHLKVLFLNSNKLEGAIPEWLRELGDLEQLDLSNNSFRGEIPEALRNLHHLKVLHLDHNELQGVIPACLGELGGLESLRLSNNSFRGEIPKALRNLRHLEALHLHCNKLEVFPKETAEGLLKLKSLSRITTSQNPWEEPSQSVIDEGLKTIIRYYEAMERSGVRESWKIKVVLVGAVCAGKSSVVTSLTAREPRPVPLAKRTRGVDVHVEKPFRPGGSRVKLVFWDFAGHDDYHSTHSLFLSDGALFLLVVDLARFVDDRSSRSNAVHIWLDALLCRTPGAVVQIIATHTDELGNEHDVETALNELRQAVHAHLTAKCAEYERGWMSGGRTGEMPSAPTLRVVYKIHAVSCKTGVNWPHLGRAIGHLAARGTTKELLSPAYDEALGEEGRLFPSVGQKIPTIWARAGAVMDALREGTDPVIAAQLHTPSSLADGARIRFLGWEDAVRIWRDIVERSDFSAEVGAGGSTEVLQDAIRLKQSGGMFLLENDLLHLDPTWINELLRAILDHRLQDPAESDFWEKQLEAFGIGYPPLKFKQLVEAHETFCATGTLTQSYLQFLWREVNGIDQGGLFDRLLETMLKHGVVFSGFDRVSTDGSVAVGGGSCEELFVPVRLSAYVGEKQLQEFSAPCVHNEWRRQLVVCVWQSYIPPGIIGIFMARLLSIEEVRFHCAWSRGVSFMMGGSEVLLYLNATGVGKAEIEVNVVGPKRSDEVETKVRKMEAIISTLLSKNFPGLRFHSKPLRSIEGKDALMEKINTLEAHLDVRLDEMEGKLDEVAASSLQSLACLKSLQVANFPYPHLFVVREHTPRSGEKTTRSRRKKWVLSKAMFKSFCTRVRSAGTKEMRLQFLCPYDFSPVPCGPDGEGYAFGSARDWVKKVFPAVQVTAVIAKVALKTVSGLDLPVSDFLNAVKEEFGVEVADRALDEDALRRVVLGEEDASSRMRGTSKASYAALVEFMEKSGYDDFKKGMRLIPDGKGQGEMVWVSKGNAKRWEELHSMAPSA
eukprot:g15166.t1